MCNVNYSIISSGSAGNAVVIEDKILIDCGVPFRDLGTVYKDLRLVLLTHRHGDHFSRPTIRALAMLRPTVRFGCGKWLVTDLVKLGVEPSRIDVYEMDRRYSYGSIKVQPFALTHNVENCGYKLDLPSGRCIYATDTNNLNGIFAKDYDLYLVEANYGEAEIEERIREKEAEGIYSYEIAARRNHLSREKCEDWLVKNMGAKSECVYMHVHEGG